MNKEYITEHKTIEIDIVSSEEIEIKVEAAKIDEMWSFVMIKDNNIGFGTLLSIKQVKHLCTLLVYVSTNILTNY